MRLHWDVLGHHQHFPTVCSASFLWIPLDKPLDPCLHLHAAQAFSFSQPSLERCLQLKGPLPKAGRCAYQRLGGYTSLFLYLSVCLFVFVSVCPSVGMSALFLYVCLYVCLYVYCVPVCLPCICLSISICPSLCVSVCRAICPSVCLSACLFVSESVRLFLYLSVYLHNCPCIDVSEYCLSSKPAFRISLPCLGAPFAAAAAQKYQEAARSIAADCLIG